MRREVPLQRRGDPGAEGALGRQHVGHAAHPLDRPLLPPAHGIHRSPSPVVRQRLVGHIHEKTHRSGSGGVPACDGASLSARRHAAPHRPRGRGADGGAEQ